MSSTLEQGVRGFVLQPSYRTHTTGTTVDLHGILETGETFVVTDDRTKPRFYVEEADAGAAQAAGGTLASVSSPSAFKTLRGETAIRVEVKHPSDAPVVRDRLHQQGVTTYEADVRFGMRHLIDGGLRGSIKIHGESVEGRRVGRIFKNPSLEPSDWVPKLRVLSLDIETDPKISKVLSVGLWGAGAKEVLLLTPPGYSRPRGALCCENEAELLKLLCERLRAIDPDVIVGWNVADFDFDVLLRRAQVLGVSFDVGRAAGETRLRRGRGMRMATQVLIPGRVVLDGPALILGSSMRMERLGLDFVGREVLGKGKTHTGGDQHAQDILSWFRSDREKLIEYNLQDAQVALEILEELKLVELAVERSRLTGMPLDRVSASVASFDFLYLTELHRRRIVAPSVGDPNGPDRENFPPMAGGHLLPMKTGLHENVLLLDFKSLYPSVMRTFQIDPLGRERAGDDAIEAPNGTRFSREVGILTGILDELMPRREEAKRSGNSIASQAIKILMNSFYGVLGTTSCRFFDPALANSITGFGKAMLIWTQQTLEAEGYHVLYGDTDSVFLSTGSSLEEARTLGPKLARELTAKLTDYLKAKYGVTSRLELEFETLYLRLFLPHVRSGTAGAAKRYAGLIDDGDGGHLSFKGLEAVRRDWTDFARETQHELYERFFHDRPVDAYLKDLVVQLRAGAFDGKLVYRKAMRKKASEYTTTTPPHVAAARKMTSKPGRLISYVMTSAGPEPEDEQQHTLDYQHYLEKQLQPIAEPILELHGLNFRKVIGDDRQLDLFSSSD